MTGDLAKLSALAQPFTTDEAAAVLDWTLGSRALAHQLTGIGCERVNVRSGKKLIRKWFMPKPIPSRTDIEADAMAACPCRCHTGTCGAHDMMLAERTIRLVEKLRPLDKAMVETIDYLVQRAGVEFAKDALGIGPLDDEVPF